MTSDSRCVFLRTPNFTLQILCLKCSFMNQLIYMSGMHPVSSSSARKKVIDSDDQYQRLPVDVQIVTAVSE